MRELALVAIVTSAIEILLADSGFVSSPGVLRFALLLNAPDLCEYPIT
jgi:hypothetical protein